MWRHNALSLVFMVLWPRTTLAQCQGVKCPSGTACKVSDGLTVCAAVQTLDYGCTSANCPTGTSCIIVNGRTACKADGKYVPGEYAIPGGLKDKGSSVVVSFEDAKDCGGVPQTQCGIGRCTNGAPTELRKCVMWPPDLALSLRRPICKFCWQIIEGVGVEATYCQFDRPQCHKASSGSGVTVAAASFVESTGFVVLLAAVFVACATCIFGAVCYQLVFRHSRRGREDEGNEWGLEPVVEVQHATKHMHNDNDEHWQCDFDSDHHHEHPGVTHECRVHEKVQVHHERLQETSHSARRHKEHGHNEVGATDHQHPHHKEAEHSAKHHHHSAEEAEHHHHHHSAEEAGHHH